MRKADCSIASDRSLPSCLTRKISYKLLAGKVWPLLAAKREELAQCYKPENGLKDRKQRDPWQQKIVVQSIWARLRIPIPTPCRKILPLLQSGAISYTLPGFRYAPPWAKVYRQSVARIHCKGVIETFIPGCNSDRLLQNLFRTPVVLDRSLKTRNRLQTFGAFRHARLNQFSLWFCFSSML
jgi:hypothetical protein